MPIWAFVFDLAAVIVFAIVFVVSQFKDLIALGLLLFALAFMFQFATTGNPVHF